jgi:predicted PurR-regulated permease PerM
MMRTDSGYSVNLNSIFLGIITVVLLMMLWQIRGILMLAVAAVMLTVLASMPVRFFMKFGVNRGLAILLSMVGGVVALIFLGMLVFPTLIAQFAVLFTDIIPSGINQLIDLWNSGEFYERIPYLQDALANVEIDGDLINQGVQQVSQALSRVGGSVLPLLGGVASAGLSMLIVFFLCIYLISQPDRYINGIISLSPLWYRDRTREILERIDTTIRAWLRVTAASMILIGLGTAAGLWLVGIDQWAALGVLSGALSFIPNFGTVAALIPAVAVAIVQAPGSVIVVVLIILVMSFIQAQIIGPILTAGTMNLAPVLVLVGQIVFGVFFGFLGIMLAVPLTAICVVLVEELYIKDVLGDIDDDEKTKNVESIETDDGMLFAEGD